MLTDGLMSDVPLRLQIEGRGAPCRVARRARPTGRELLDHPPRDPGGEQRIACDDHPHRLGDRLLPGRGLTDDAHVRLGVEQGREAGARHGGVVGEQHGDRHAGSSG